MQKPFARHYIACVLLPCGAQHQLAATHCCYAAVALLTKPALYSRLVKHIAVLTSGGDAPGMNPAIRAVVRTAIAQGLQVSAVFRGYQGLIDDDIKSFGPRDVANIIQRGGTVLRTARCRHFFSSEGRSQAVANLKARGIEGLVVIGGDGSFRGAEALHREHDFPVVGLPGTIDNDIYGTDVSIGFNTALDIALNAIDRLRDTAASHDRMFLVEVMGRHAGHIALYVGVAGGAEEILLPEVPVNIERVVASLREAEARGKASSIVVVAEGACEGGALAIAQALHDQCSFEVRTSILGHIQRGGSPCTRDRVLASRLGHGAVKALLEGHNGIMIGIRGRSIRHVPLRDTWEKRKELDWQLYETAKLLTV